MKSDVFESLADAAAALAGRPLHLAIGMFDGVHLGHRAVIEAAVASAHTDGSAFAKPTADEHGLPSRVAVLTFWPHPSAVLNPARATRLLMEPPAKERVILGLGVDALITQRFDADFAKISAEEFLPYLKRFLPNLVAVYVGENWRFGCGRKGDIALLVAEGRKHGITIFSAPRVNLDGEPISSTRIRAALEAGEIGAVNAMLGYSYFSEGKVVPGKGLGKTIGFPTLNVAWNPQVRPKYGVYAVSVRGPKTEGRGPVAGIANYGLRPTVENAAEPRLEVHVLGDCPFQAGDEVCVEWQRFVRPEMKFGSVEELKRQIAADIAGIG